MEKRPSCFLSHLGSPVNCDTGVCDIALGHEFDLSLCHDLESVADGLPELPPARDLRRLTDRLLSASERWADCSHLKIFEQHPAVLAARQMDSMHADDVIDALWDYWRGPEASAAGQLGYMLRALFDGRRRSVALERLVLGCDGCQSSETD